MAVLLNDLNDDYDGVFDMERNRTHASHERVIEKWIVFNDNTEKNAVPQ